MTRPETTYELVIEPVAGAPHERILLKQALITWLSDQGVNEFVEGTVECDDAGWDESQNLDEVMAGASISVIKYSQETLSALARGVSETFGERVVTRMRNVATSVWLDGWKDSFQPFSTQKFYVYPPWRADEIPADRIPIEIEPGMAFGTGQHATTQLCLQAIERIWEKAKHDYWLDVGSGTAILAIGAKKLGVDRVIATDIDVDAVMAAKDNIARNGVVIDVVQGSFPTGSTGTGDDDGAAVLIANILTPVLQLLMAQFAEHVRPGGYVILSGLLVEDIPDLVERARAVGLVHESSFDLEGWGCLMLQKKD